MNVKNEPELDGTLRAIVAADRIALSGTSEGQDLMRRRLTVFYGYFALMGTFGVVGGRMRLPLDIDPGVLAFIRNVQAVHAFVLCAAFLSLRFWVRDLRLMGAIDLLATVATSLAAAFALSVMPSALTADVSAVSFFLLFFTVRAALVPSQPWLAMPSTTSVAHAEASSTTRWSCSMGRPWRASSSPKGRSRSRAPCTC